MRFRYYFKDMPYSAEVDPCLGIIGFAKSKKQPWQTDSRQEFIGDIMHELVHILWYKQGKFKAYHRWPTTRAQRIAFLATAWRAERAVDLEAKRLTKFFFNMDYKLAYKTKTDKYWFDKTILDPLRVEWGFK